jgi:glutaredoxin-related protein
MEFLEKYIRGTSDNPKYSFIKDLLTILSQSKDSFKNTLKDFNRNYIKNKITDYYNVTFIVNLV